METGLRGSGDDVDAPNERDSAEHPTRVWWMAVHDRWYQSANELGMSMRAYLDSGHVLVDCGLNRCHAGNDLGSGSTQVDVNLELV